MCAALWWELRLFSCVHGEKKTWIWEEVKTSPAVFVMIKAGIFWESSPGHFLSHVMSTKTRCFEKDLGTFPGLSVATGPAFQVKPCCFPNLVSWKQTKREIVCFLKWTLCFVFLINQCFPEMWIKYLQVRNGQLERSSVTWTWKKFLNLINNYGLGLVTCGGSK